MNRTRTLHDLGQSLWLDNITRDLLQNGTLQQYINQFSVTGLTSNPAILHHAITNSPASDRALEAKVRNGTAGEELFFELAMEDLTRAADLFRPIWDRTDGVDGWVSLEVSAHRPRHTPHDRGRQALMPGRCGGTCSSRSGHLGRTAGDRGVHFSPVCRST